MSTEHQQYSLDNQATMLRLYAAQRGYEIVRTYADSGRSGVRLAGRPALQRLFADVDGGQTEYKAVLVYDMVAKSERLVRYHLADRSRFYLSGQH